VTHLQDAVSSFEDILESGKIRRSDLADFFEVAKETGTLVQRNLDRAAHLIRSFRMVAVDQAMEDRRTVLLGQYVGEIVDSLKPTLRKHGVLVTLDCVKDIEIKTVPGDLAHILTNLIMNAALHAFKGKKGTTSKLVRTQVKRRGDYIYIDVADNGTGIPDEIKEKVFDPFFTTARAEGGSGLGLNIVYNTVYQKLAGKIEICDNEGGGTLFKIRFPVDPDA
jgi:signal transduction histidine kinase